MPTKTVKMVNILYIHGTVEELRDNLQTLVKGSDAKKKLSQKF